MEHRLVGLDQPQAWSGALAGLVHPHAHTHAHVAAFAASSPDTTFLYVGQDGSGKTLVACPLSVRGEAGEQDVYSPYGFGGFAAAADRPGFAAEWDEFAASQGWVASYVLQHPDLDADLGFLDPSPITCFVWDLTSSEEELLAKMTKSRRQDLRSWARREVAVTNDPAEVLTFVLDVADTFFDDREAASLYHFRQRTWTALLEAPTVRCFGARESGSLVAAVVVGVQDGIVDGMFSICRPGAGAHSGPLMWESARATQSEGATSFNLGGGVRPDDSVATYKRRFGADVRPAPTLRLVHRRETYDDLCRRAGVSSDLGGFFPPYRRSTS